MKSFMSRMAHLSSASARQVRKLFVLIIVALFAGWPLLDRAQAAAGDLDSTFGNGGKLTTDFFSGNGEADSAITVIQPDKKIVVAGTVKDHSNGGAQKIAVARYNSNGSLDLSFGSSGKAIVSFSGFFNFALDLAIQPDGKLVVAGAASNNSTGLDFAVVRFNSNGSLDPTFGSGGIAVTDFAHSSDMAFAVALQPDGKIVAGGFSSDILTIATFFSLTRYNPDGSLDSSFGSGGKVVTDPDGALNAQIRDLLIQPDGRIVAVGLSSMADFNVSLARYRTDGSLDPTFGIGGKTTSDFGSQEEGRAAVLQPDGKIVVTGQFAVPITHDRDFAIARYNSNGTLDLDFGNNGLATTDFFGRFDLSEAIALQGNGKILVAGRIHPPEDFSGFNDFGLARFNADGSLDPGFSSDGKATVDFGDDAHRLNDSALSVAVQQDGKILAVGVASENNSFRADFALARFEGDSGNSSGDFDTCLQDDSLQDNKGSLLEFNSTTGDYQFTDCRKGVILAGRGIVRIRFCKIEFTVSKPDHSITALANSCTKVGSASVKLLPSGRTFTISDRNMANNTCACR